ncbi:hypothetical protein V5O48_001520 [Marasmius crinis-equi]|uniref:Uncharacterized protein n=1 Tax=Marasmius crinis-equi TaxID=585013 RepID=A0ABR3FYA4_9AGAR
MPAALKLSDDAPLPPLPKFRSKDIERKVFTHRSYYGRPNHVFEDQPDSPSPDNEKFEHLGDSVLSLVVTEMLLEMYPGLRVGPSTKTRALIVGNTTLANVSRRYQLPRRLYLHPAQAIALRASTHVQADVFEAVIGGLYTDQGLDGVKPWLKALFHPYAIAAYNIVRAQHGLCPVDQPQSSATSQSESSSSPSDSAPSSPQSGSELPLRHAGYSNPEVQVGYLALFNQTVTKRNLPLEWSYVTLKQHLDDTNGQMQNQGTSRRNRNGNGTQQDFFIDPDVVRQSVNMTPVWIVKAMVNGDCYGEGKGGTKKAAKNDAAKMGLRKLGIDL